MTAKSKQLCVGCRNNYYNGQGASECWSYKTAKVVTRYMIGWWTRPTDPGAFAKLETLHCHHAPGQYVMYEKLPDFVKPETNSEKEPIMPKANFPTATRVSPVYVIDGALYTRTTGAAAMENPDAIRARVQGSDGIERVSWFVAAFECAPEETDEDMAADAAAAVQAVTEKPRIAAG